MRKFDIGRQSESLMNDKLYEIIKSLETLNSQKDNLGEEPSIKKDGSVWIDEGDLKYSKEGNWNLFYENKFKLITEILSPTTPQNPVTGQLWIKDGVLLYFDGYQWSVAKAKELNELEDGFNISAYKDFLMIDPLRNSGEHVIVSSSGTPIEYSQFLIPNSDTDRFFVNGINKTDFERLSNVSLQYPTELLKNTITSAVHLNPEKLINIEKRMIMVDKRPDVPIDVKLHNTEMYGMVHGTGKLLIKHEDFIEDIDGRPVLNNESRNLYDFVLCHTYIFGDVKKSGELFKINKNINESSYLDISSNKLKADSIAIIFKNGQVNLGFDFYEIDYKKELIHFKDVSVGDEIALFSVGEHLLSRGGDVKTLSSSGGSIIELSDLEHFENHLHVAIIRDEQGMRFEAVKNIDKNSKIGEVDAGQIGSFYAIINIPLEGNNHSPNVESHGSCDGNNYIDISNYEGKDKFFLIVDGLYVSKDKIINDPITERIYCDELATGSEYILLRDSRGLIIFEDKIHHLLTPSYGTDSSLVFMKGNLICDASSMITHKLNDFAKIGEIRNIVDAYGNSSWYECKSLDEKGLAIWEKLRGRTSHKSNLIAKGNPVLYQDTIKLYSEEDAILESRKKTEELFPEGYIELEIEERFGKVTQKIIRDDKSKNLSSMDGISIVKDDEGDEVEVLIEYQIEYVNIKIPDNLYIQELNYVSGNEIDETSLGIISDEIIQTIKDINYVIEEVVLHDGTKNHLKRYLDLDIEVELINKGLARISVMEKYPNYKEIAGKIEHLELTKNGYSQDKSSINIINHFGYEDMTSYSYRFANTIESPLSLYDIEANLKDNDTGFYPTYKKFYDMGLNSVSVWIDGIRQYEIEELDEKRIRFDAEVEEDTFVDILVAANYDMYNPRSITNREVLSVRDTAPGMYNTYRTRNVDLSKGFVSLYVDGIRQTSDVFNITSRNTIFIDDADIPCFSEDSKILIEVKDDYLYKEQSIIVNEPLVEGIIDIKKYDIDRSILSSGEDILIFIDGVAYGSKYAIDKDKEIITLYRKGINRIGLGYFHPSTYNGNIANQEKNIITFEWR